MVCESQWPKKLVCESQWPKKLVCEFQWPKKLVCESQLVCEFLLPKKMVCEFQRPQKLVLLADNNKTNNYYYYHINNLLESSSVDFLPYLSFEATRVTQRATWGNQVSRGGSVEISRSASSALGGWRLGGSEVLKLVCAFCDVR